MYYGLHVVVLKGWCDLDAECDCLQVINILSHGSPSLFYFGAITESCLAINSSFSSIVFHFVRRSDNVLAHELASNPCFSGLEGFSLPSDLDNLI